ncbi:MAG: guanylate kinase, partial [Eubacteriales bacterium]
SSQIDMQLDAGRNVLLDIDVRGALAIRKLYPSAVLIWLLPESFSQLESRLRERGTESEEKIRGRLDKAREELNYFDEFDYLVVNEYGRIDRAADDVLTIVRAAAMRTKLCRGFYDKFVREMQ